MKKAFLVLLSCTIWPVFAFGDEPIKVRGTAAQYFLHALEAVGAKKVPTREGYIYQVEYIHCEAGLMSRSGPFSFCNFILENNQEGHLRGGSAGRFMSQLTKAGVPRLPGREGSSLRTGRMTVVYHTLQQGKNRFEVTIETESDLN